jgi:tetrahydromethanopterin S-methyltransferase subunit G
MYKMAANIRALEVQLEDMEKEEDDAWGEVMRAKHAGTSYDEVTKLIHKAETLNETRKRLLEFKQKLDGKNNI